MLKKVRQGLGNCPVLLQSGIVFVVALLLACVHGGIGGLQNDDMQISFMLNGGGAAPGPFSLYTNVCLGWALCHLSSIWPGVNWYYCFLCAMTAMASLAINYSACERAARCSIVYKIATLLFLVYINYRGMITIQYTHVGVYAACAAVLLLSRIFDRGVSVSRLVVSSFLLFAAFCLRTSVLLPAAFLLIGIVVAEWQRLTEGCILRRFGFAVAVPLLLCGCAFIVNTIEYRNSPEWDNALRFLQARVQIVDSKDNSGLDKGADLLNAGISPESYSIFKKFVYVPEMDNLDTVESALRIHKNGRKGVLGSSAAADVGLLEFQMSNLKPKNTLARSVTPYTPLGIAVFLLLLFPERKRLLKAAGMLVAVGSYLCILTLMDRLVGRVMDPLLYASALYVMSIPEESSHVRCWKWRAAGAVLLSALACMFCFRHLKEPSDNVEAAWAYCESKPDTLFFTCSMQFPWATSSKLEAFSLQHLQNTNILPLADGWIFYTPAYKAALKARGISNPYVRLMQPNAQLITRKQGSRQSALQCIQKEIYAQTGQCVDFEKVAERGVFEFWTVNFTTSNPSQ